MSNPLFQDKGDRSKRKFCCFCCGMVFLEIENYRVHIIEEHEEGRDFILCPQCEYPIRCLKSHWEVKHPSLPIPKNMQTRAIIWKNFTAAGEKKRSKKPTFKTGDFPSKKNKKTIHYRSGYELEVYELLEQMPDVVGYSAEQFDIQYLHEGTVKIYKPDIFIVFLDGHKEIWEIKPATQTSLPINESKWTSAHRYCEDRGWKFIVMTEVGIGKLKKHVRDLKKDL